MTTKKILAPLAALAMASAPVAAQAQPMRISAPMDDAEFQGMGSSALILAGVIVALIVLVVLASDDNEPYSP